MRKADEAVHIAERTLAAVPANSPSHGRLLKRKEAALELGVSTDVLRNWEANGFLSVKRAENGYRMYAPEDMDRLRIVRALRCANYSIASILRLMSALDEGGRTDVLVLAVKIPDAVSARTEDAPTASGLFADVREGLRYARENRSVALVLGSYGAFMFPSVPTGFLVPLLMERVFGLMGSMCAGLVPLGSIVFGPLADAVPIGALAATCGAATVLLGGAVLWRAVVARVRKRAVL